MKRHGLRRFYVVGEGVFGEAAVGRGGRQEAGRCEGCRCGRRRARRNVPVLADGAAGSGGRPARRADPRAPRGGHDRRRQEVLEDPVRVHVPGAVHRPRPDDGQDRQAARGERVAGADDPGALACPRPRLALRQGPERPALRGLLPGRSAPPEGRRNRRRPPRRLRPAARRRHTVLGRDPRPAKRREPGRRADAPRVHPLPQPRGRHAARRHAGRGRSSCGRGRSSPGTTSG